MIQGRPSRTAQRVALRRAAHQLFDTPKVLEDPLAVRIVGREAAASISSLADRLSPTARYMRAFMAARARFAEDELALAVRRGVTQFVVLGAGLDTFAYRNPFANLRVFEVDHPATQEWKRQRLAAENIAIPVSVTYAAVDFNTQTLADGLQAANFQADKPAFFSWLGVTMYLEPQTVLDTLRLVHTMSPENGIVFDYTVPRHLLNTVGKLILDAIMNRVAAAGEPFRGFFVPTELAADLSQIGYRHTEDLDSAAINARYFANRTDKLKVAGAMGRLCCARG
ncbi:MAG TPA: class I SAM-dependent methyltransferase [Candidatus Acidoferrum sp.]|jgi:methyltransferase (TIGR00027 family)